MSSIAAFPQGIRRNDEARKARKRLYPVTALYTIYGTTVLVFALRSHPLIGPCFFLCGGAVWTCVEYLVHRYILHGRFPDGPGTLRRFCHMYFDDLHWEHHKRPWDGNHINGTISDTLPFTAPLALLSLLLPVHTLSAFWAGLLQAYIVEEWVHHSVHFWRLESRYFQYIKRHHLYHHSPRGSEVAYGLTNGFWDVVCQTRIPPGVRRALYAPLRASRPPSPAAGA